MKRLCLATILVLVLAGAAAAAGVGFGVKGGLNMANLHGTDAENLDWKPGFAAGAFAEIALTPVVSLQPEVLYVMNGASESFLGIEIDFNLDYIQVPVLVKFDLPVAGTIVPTLYAGPYVGFLMGAEVEASYQGESESMDVKDYTKSMDYGLSFGAAIDVNLAAATLIFEGRYNYGLTTIDDGWAEALEEENVELDIKNHSIMFMVGVGF
ncbi:MAG: porin family protein [Candidatus Krumholzibacteria bacterium]|nr:porin family protein [Candidatus Krumholzibacteria bacterium]